MVLAAVARPVGMCDNARVAFGLSSGADDPAGDSAAAVASRVGHLVVGSGVDNERTPIRIKEAARAAHQAQVTGQGIESAGAVGADL